MFTPVEVCKRFAQVGVTVPPAPVGGAVPAGVTGALTGDNAAVLAARFRALGYHWAGADKVTVSRHTFDGGKPVRKGRQYELRTADYTGLEWAVRLFKAIVGGKQTVDQRVGIDLTLTPTELAWLYAENVPLWVPIPVGTAEATPRFIHAVRVFQAVVAGRPTTEGSTGRIDPHDATEEWLDAPHAPKWMPLGGAAFDVTLPLDRHRFRAVVPDWTQELVAKAATLYDAARVGQPWQRLAVLHPSAATPDRGAESGLRVRVPLAGLLPDARVAIATSFKGAEHTPAGHAARLPRRRPGGRVHGGRRQEERPAGTRRFPRSAGTGPTAARRGRPAERDTGDVRRPGGTRADRRRAERRPAGAAARTDFAARCAEQGRGDLPPVTAVGPAGAGEHLEARTARLRTAAQSPVPGHAGARRRRRRPTRACRWSPRRGTTASPAVGSIRSRRASHFRPKRSGNSTSGDSTSCRRS